MAQTRRDTQHELTDLIRKQTELECLVEDLRAASQNTGGRREDIEAEIEQLESQIEEKEEQLAELVPEWEQERTNEASEKKRLDEAAAKLGALFSKQGRASKFRTQRERDNFLRQEIASVGAYKKSQTTAYEASRSELNVASQSLEEIDAQENELHDRMEEARKKGRELAESVSGLKEKHTELTEKRKDLWREDTKLEALVSRAADELRTAERSLAGMMDKVCSLDSR